MRKKQPPIRSFLLTSAFICAGTALAGQPPKLTAPQPANDTGFYTKVDGGVSLLQGIDLSWEGVSLGKAKSKSGFAISGILGYKINPIFSVEVESGYSENSWKDTPGLPSLSGNTSVVPVLGNLVFTPKISENVSLSLGAGIGAAINGMELTASKADLSALTGTPAAAIPDALTHWKESNASFMGQLKAGLSFKLSDNISADLNYRLRLIDGPSYSLYGTSLKSGTVVGHVISAGIGISF